MKILIFSWRDIKDPSSGGAEILTMRLAESWVKEGHRVGIVSAQFPGAKKIETFEGIKIYRPAHFGGQSPLKYLLFLYQTVRFYRKNLAGKYDLVIDQVHGLPSFTPFFVKEQVIFFPLEVAKSIWFYEVRFPFSLIGYFLELASLKLFKNFPFLTISSSTAQDLKNLGIQNVSTVAPGTNYKPLRKVPRKSRFPLLLSLGRITEMKRIEDSVFAFRLLHKELPQIKLVIVGKGKEKYLKKLKNLCHLLGIDDRVIFTGYLSEKEKKRLLSEAWILVSTSLREGWGLTVLEAAACGTPTVAYKISGFVDSVIDGQTGFLCQRNNPHEIVKNIRRLLLNRSLRKRFSQNALGFSRQFSWEKTAKETLEIFKKIIKE